MNRKNDQILIVDDDPMIQKTVEIMLEEMGYEIISANGGNECLDALHKGFRGLVLMDVMMPAMDGWKTIVQIAEQGLLQGNAICMLTAVLDPDEEMHNLAQYIWDYVRKPCQQEELIDVVENAMEMLNANRTVQHC